jgi:glycosyltransferase involved in cell wall biosynthesis
MNLLYLNNYNYLRGGAETVVLGEANLLKERGHSVDIFSRTHPQNNPSRLSSYFPEAIMFDSVKLNVKNIKKLSKILYNWEARRCMNRALKTTKGLNLAHAHNIYGGLTTSVLDILHKQGIPIVLTLHDYKLICPNYKLLSHGKICEDCKGHKYYMAIKNKCHKDSLIASAIYSIETYFNYIADKYFKNIKMFISPSKFLQNKFVEFGWPPEKITYLPNFVSITDFIPNFNPGQYFLYIGRLSSEKGIYTLIRAFMKIRSKKCDLMIVGDGPIRNELERYAEKDQRIHFTGYLSGNSLKNATQNARAVIVPSEWYENAPLSVLEALSFGKPVLGANIGGIPEMIDEDNNGYLFKPGDVDDLKDKMELMLTMSDKKIILMGKAGRNKVEKEYNPDLHYDGLMKIYNDVVLTS